MGGQNVLLGIVPFIIVFAVYYIFPMFGDVNHRGYEAGFLYQYVDRALFLIFATCLCFAFLVLYLKVKMPKVIAGTKLFILLFLACIFEIYLCLCLSL